MTTLSNHTAEYLSGTSGAYTLFCSIRTGAECVDYFTGEKSPLSASVQTLTNATMNALTWPGLAADTIDLYKERTVSAVISVVEWSSYALEYLHENKLADFSAHMPVISSVGYGAGMISDGLTIRNELTTYFGPDGSGAKGNLSLIRIAEKIYSICRSILGLAALAVGSAVAPQLGLFLTVNYLVARVANYYYEKIMVL